jgi:hypothetical protein
MLRLCRPRRALSWHFRLYRAILCSLAVLIGLLACHSRARQLSIEEIAPTHSDRLAVGILTMSWFAHNIRYWSTHFVPEFYRRDYGEYISFWGDEPKNWSLLAGVPYHAVPPRGDRSRHALKSKLRAAFEHFLSETTAGWFIRIVGDTAINFEMVPLFLAELKRDYDPLTDRVIQGNCLGKYELTYVQGGSGFLFSRRAVFQLLEDWAWIEEMSPDFSNDDRLLSHYIKHVNISWRDATNRFFVGHSFWNFTSAWKALEFQFHRPCIERPKSKKGCRSYFTRVKDIVFWHDRARFMRFIGRIDTIRGMIPEDLYFHIPNNKPMLCRSNRSISGYYD